MAYARNGPLGIGQGWERVLTWACACVSVRVSAVQVDVLFDARLRPWILEANLSPSLDIRASPRLQAVKDHVLRDTVRLAVTRPRAPTGLPPAPAPDSASFQTARQYWIEAETRRELANLGGFQPLFYDPASWPEIFPLLADRNGHAARLYAALNPS